MRGNWYCADCDNRNPRYAEHCMHCNEGKDDDKIPPDEVPEIPALSFVYALQRLRAGY